MQRIFLATEKLLGVPSFRKTGFRLLEMPQKMNYAEGKKSYLNDLGFEVSAFENWLQMISIAEQLAPLQA
jgi:hypothetical protein